MSNGQLQAILATLFYCTSQIEHQLICIQNPESNHLSLDFSDCVVKARAVMDRADA